MTLATTVQTQSKESINDSLSSFGEIQRSTSWHTFVLATIALPTVSMLLGVAIFAILLVVSPTWLRTVLVAYLVYVAIDSTPTRGGWTWMNLQSKLVEDLFRRFCLYNALAAYFPVQLVKTAELPPEKGPYILAYHPHGVIGVGAVGGLLSNATDFDVKFPGLPRRVATLNLVFLVPILRDLLLLMGWISVHKSALTKTLKRGESVVLLPGGASEAMLAKPGTFELFLNQRKGFIKLALQNKASIVPVLGFGENDAFSVYVPEEGTWTARVQKHFYKLTSFTLPLMKSPFAQRNPVHVVVGKPVEFDPKQTVDECHAQYIQAVTDLYNRNKAQYGHGHIALDIQ